MKTFGAAFRRPSPKPSWLAAVLTVSGILLVLGAMPMLISAVSPAGSDAIPVAYSTAMTASAAASATVSSADCPAASTDSATTPPSSTPKASPKVTPKGTPQASPKTTPKPSPAAQSNSSSSDTSQTFGVAPSGFQGRAMSGALSADVSPGDCPLPKTGEGGSLLRFALALAFLFGGVAVLATIGFSAARPWPGRYVRRI